MSIFTNVELAWIDENSDLIEGGEVTFRGVVEKLCYLHMRRKMYICLTINLFGVEGLEIKFTIKPCKRGSMAKDSGKERFKLMIFPKGFNDKKYAIYSGTGALHRNTAKTLIMKSVRKVFKYIMFNGGDYSATKNIYDKVCNYIENSIKWPI